MKVPPESNPTNDMFRTKGIRDKKLLPIFGTLIIGTVLIFSWNGGHQAKPNQISLEAFLVKPNMSDNAWHVLPNLRELQWPIAPCAPDPTGRKFPNGTVYPLPKAFEPLMSCGQRALSKRMLKRFSDLMFENGLGDRFILNGGTLVGSFQHHDFVPWDDDVDVMIDITVRDKVRERLVTLGPEYTFVARPSHDKIFTPLIDEKENELDVERSRHSSRYSWGWPYIDIGYFESNSTHVWDLTNRNNPRRIISKLILFPLMFRPLGLDWYPTPYDTLGYIRQVYGRGGGCAIFGYSHVLEGRGPSGRMPCWSLGKRYAFVEHRLVRPDQYKLVDSEGTIAFTVGKETLFYRTRYGPLVVHTIHLPTLFDHTDVNMYSFADEDL